MGEADIVPYAQINGSLCRLSGKSVVKWRKACFHDANDS